MFVRRTVAKNSHSGCLGYYVRRKYEKGRGLALVVAVFISPQLAATEELERVVASKMAARMDVYVLDEEDQLFNSYLIVVAEYRSRDHIRQKHNSPQLPTAANEHSSPTVSQFRRLFYTA